jgi:UPF0716 protein FxsA
MRVVLLLILLAFPVIDLSVTVRVARWTGVPVWLWLTMSVVGGFLLLRNERGAFRGHLIASMHGGQPVLRGLLDSGRKVLAGLLLLLPGLVSDFLALILLALPLNLDRDLRAVAAGPGRSTRRSTLDGEFRRLD